MCAMRTCRHPASYDEWSPSEFEGLDAYHDGQKWWYRCRECAYFNDRSYHSRMHYQRIHVNGGRAMQSRRKFADAAIIPAYQEPKKVKKTSAKRKKREPKTTVPRKVNPPSCAEKEEDAEDTRQKNEVVFTFGGGDDLANDYDAMLDQTLIGHYVSFRSIDLPTTSSSHITPLFLATNDVMTPLLHLNPTAHNEFLL